MSVRIAGPELAPGPAADNQVMDPTPSMTPSLIRTWVPLLVSFLAAWLVSRGIEVDDQSRTLLVSGVGSIVGGVYYAAVRLLERKFAWATLLLGSTQQPTQYAPAATPVTGATTAEVVEDEKLDPDADVYGRHAAPLPIPDDPAAPAAPTAPAHPVGPPESYLG